MDASRGLVICPASVILFYGIAVIFSRSPQLLPQAELLAGPFRFQSLIFVVSLPLALPGLGA